MVVAPSPNTKATASPTVKDKKRKMRSISGEEEGIKSETKADTSASQAKKRNSNPGVRVIRGRVYDSENGTTCHQCRQKTYAVYATCKNKAKIKPCPLKYCNTCLLNRYGEKVEEVNLLDEWSCPKCRDACNCSICRKKRGYEPTGQLSQMAKAGGFSSVSNMLDVKGAQSVSNYKRVKETCASPRKQFLSEEGIVIASPKKKGKENLFDGKTDSNADMALAISPSFEKPKKSNQKKLKTEGSKEIVLENGNSDAMKPKKSNQKKEKAEESKEIVLENGNNDVVKPKKVNQKKVKAEESKEKVLENGNNDEIKPKKPNQKKSKAEGSKEIVLENGNNDAVKPKKSNKKKLQPEESKEVVLENGNSDAIKPKKPNQKKEKAEESKEIVLENGNNDVSKPKKVNQKRAKPEGSIEIVLEIENNGGNKPKKLTQKKLKLEGSKETIVENGNNDAVNMKKVNQKKLKPEGSKEVIVENGKIEEIKPKKITQKKLKLEKSNEVNGENGTSGAILKVDGVQKKQKGIKKSNQDQNKVDENGKAVDGGGDQNGKESMKDKESSKVDKNALHFVDPVITLPTGSELVTIAGIDIPKEDAGNALQLLEFCSTFGKILDVKKGQAEAVLRDLFKGRTTRRGKYSVLIQFHIQLLSIIQSESESESELESEPESPKSEPTNGKDSWLKDLKNCIPKSFLSEKIDCIDGKASGYDNLDSSIKLRLLTFLCDEVLGTEKVRNWMDEQNAKFAEKKKEARGKLFDAREKEKSLKQKMQDDIAKAIIKREGVPLTLIEHDAIVSKIKKEAAEAHAEMLACKKMVPIDNERPDAVRTEPIYKDNNGHFYWRLKGCSDKSGILLQDVGNGDLSLETLDKWFGYDDEQMDVVEKQLNILRFRARKGNKN